MGKEAQPQELKMDLKKEPEGIAVSLPTGTTIDLLERYEIYSRPVSIRKFKETPYMTFRRRDGGEMRYLYKCSDIVCFKPSDPNDARLKDINPDIRERIEGYIKDGRSVINEEEGKRDYYFFILSDKIELINRPKPSGVVRSIAYYKISDLRSKKRV